MKFPNLETVILFGQFVFLFQADTQRSLVCGRAGFRGASVSGRT